MQAYDPEDNIQGGVRHLRQLLDRYGGNVRLVLAAYNAGAGAVEKHGGVPPYPETWNYLERVLRFAITTCAGRVSGLAALPNLLTLFRIALIPILVLLLLEPGRGRALGATLAFQIACWSDFFDGYLARTRNLTTKLGKFLDPSPTS